MTPSAWPAGRIVTFATGSAFGDSAATSACPDSCTATACFSPGMSALVASRRPSRMRSRASEKSAAEIVSRPSRTATIAASLSRFARSAPEKPGVERGDRRRGRRRRPRCLPRACTARIAVRSRRFGSGISTWRSKRPGRSSAGSSVSGRFVAASTTTPERGVEAVHLGEHLVEGLLALVVRHERAAAPLTDRVDLVDEDDRGRGLARRREQIADARRADADEHLDEARAGEREERNVGLTCDGARQQRLARSRRADHEHAPRRDRARGRVAIRRASGSRRLR